MKLPNVNASFVWVVLACGVITLIIIIGNLTVLGLKRPTLPDLTAVNWEEHQKGRLLLTEYGCGGCHIVPGLSKARGRVGPSLEDLHEQTFIAGVIANNFENLSAWIRHPDTLAPGTAMPNLGVTEEDAKVMASYLLNVSRRRLPNWFRSLWTENEDRVTRPLPH